MATPLFEYSPVRDSYTFTPAYDIVQTKLDGGKSRQRQDVLNGTHTITPTWVLNRGEYTRFMGFFRERLMGATLQFRMNLLTDYAFVMPHVCTCVGGAPKLHQQSGDAYFVSGTLEVTPNPTKSFNMFLNNAIAPEIVDAATGFYPAEMTQFPVGRSVILVNTLDTAAGWGGVTVNLDGTYVILAAPNAFTRTLTNAPAVNPGWTTLAGLTPAFYHPTFGAAVLVPE